jgi:hypothetical protein
MIGKVYGIPPQPPVAEHTRVLPAGAVVFGVEYRVVDPDTLRELYSSNAEHLDEFENRSPYGGFYDRGVSIHVSGGDGWEYVRFDVFDDEPHYHYIHRTTDGSVVNQVVDFDVTAHGDMLDWTVARLRTRLAEMLRAAGGAKVASELNESITTPAIDEVDRLARTARERRATPRRAD